MTRKHVLVIVGTRPEAIKVAPVIAALKADARFNVVVCVTGQHRQMLDGMLSAFGIQADVSLDLMVPDQSLSDLVARCLKAVDAVIADAAPDWVVAQGDTSSCMAAALAAFHRRVPFAHLEAGLRTHNLHAPWPEEMNRQVVARMASLHFATTARARENLLRENIPEAAIHVTGNTGIDALLQMRQRLTTDATQLRQIDSRLPDLSGRKCLLVTMHRRENLGPPLEQACRALATLASTEPVDIVFPVHRNPRVRQPVHANLDGVGAGPGRIHLVDPLDYPSFVRMMDLSDLILSDSGGIQEEALVMGKPVLIMRDQTERPEVVEAGVGMLIAPQGDAIVDAVRSHLAGKVPVVQARPNAVDDGHAAERVVDLLASFTPPNNWRQ
jgi:UDP-N-acetylglucosamine 2-epimerase (non-hydrolysing)